MAPVCTACHLPLSVLCVFLLFLLFVTHQVDSLLVYDRQELLNIRLSAGNVVRFGVDGQNTCPPPFPSDLPAFLCRPLAPPPPRKRYRRRGKRSGLLVRLKARSAVTSENTTRFPSGLFAGHGASHTRSISYLYLDPVVRWLVPIVGADAGLDVKDHPLFRRRPLCTRIRGVNLRSLRPLQQVPWTADGNVPGETPHVLDMALINA